MELYQADLAERPSLVVVNKMDLPEAKANLKQLAKKIDMPLIKTSAVAGLGIEHLQAELRKLIL